MPEFTVKEVRLPELHLPEIKRDEIVHALSGIRLPDVELTVGERRRQLRGRSVWALRWGRTGLSGNDVGKFIGAVAATLRFVRPLAPRSRWGRVGRSRGNLVTRIRPQPRRSGRRFVLVALVAGAVGSWIVLRDPAIRMRLNRAAREARRRIDEMRSARSEGIELDTSEPVSVTTSEIAATPDEEIVVAQAEAATNP